MIKATYFGRVWFLGPLLCYLTERDFLSKSAVCFSCLLVSGFVLARFLGEAKRLTGLGELLVFYTGRAR